MAGRRLFRGDEAIDTLQEVMTAPIPRLRRLGSRIPAALDDVIARGLSRDLDTRYLTAKDFAEAIERAIGKGNIGSPAEVAHMIEAVFGPRMRVRHERIREAMTGKDADRVLEASGLPLRAPPTATMRMSVPEVLAAVAPPAPSARYTFGKGNDYAAKIFPRKPPWRLVAALVGGIALGAILVFSLVKKTPVSTAPVASAAKAIAAPVVATRHVTVPLPFVATFVSFDDVARELNPASDVVAFDVPSGSAMRHRVSAVALDGTRAEGYVREENGTTTNEEDGFSFEGPDALQVASPTSSSTPRAGGKRRYGPKSPPPLGPSIPPPQPTGTVKNGFTKLK